MLKEFKQFLLRGNVVDLAVGVVIGAAFGSVVNALVKDVLTPLISAIAKAPDFSNLSLTIRGSQILYGDFLNNLISFIIAGSAVFFFVVKPMNILTKRMHKEDHINPTTKKCPECRSDIPLDAKRCAHCAQAIG